MSDQGSELRIKGLTGTFYLKLFTEVLPDFPKPILNDLPLRLRPTLGRGGVLFVH